MWLCHARVLWHLGGRLKSSDAVLRWFLGFQATFGVWKPRASRGDTPYLDTGYACYPCRLRLLLGVGASERQNPCVCIPHTLRRDWKFHVVYGLLWLTCDYQLVIGLCKFTQNFNNDCSKKRNSDRSFSTTRPNSLKRYLDFVLSITSY